MTQNKEEERVYLAVPYGEREAARAAGAFWDKEAKSWYIGPKGNRSKLERWLPKNVSLQQDLTLSPEEEFAEALGDLGCYVTGEHPIMDGNPQRISVEGDKGKTERSGFYVGHLDGHPAGYIKNNRTGVEIRWKAKNAALDAQEKAQLHAEAAAKTAQRIAERKQLKESTAQKLIQELQNLVIVTTPTPYLKTKGIQIFPGILTDSQGQKTYIPAFDANGKLWTLQTIASDGTKRFAKNSRKEGCFHPIGGMDALKKVPVLIFAEGYATAASLSEAVDQSVIAVFDSGNLLPVVRTLHGKFPDKAILIAGDDDKHLEQTQEINVGRLKAEQAARGVGGKAIFPIFAPGEQMNNPKDFTDFNDLATKSTLGKEGVERQVKAALQMVLERTQRQREQQKEYQQQEQQRQRPPRRLVRSF